jgi:hypothetical protein
VLSRPSSGTQSGEDFAAFLRHQIASLQNPQRQELAGDNAPKLTDTPTNKTNKGCLNSKLCAKPFTLVSIYTIKHPVLKEWACSALADITPNSYPLRK